MNELKKFIKAIRSILIFKRPLMGIVIRKTSKEINWDNLLKTKYQRIKLDDKEENFDKINKKIQRAFINKEWIIFSIQGNISSLVYNQLKLLAKDGRLTLFHTDEKLLIRQPQECRLILEIDGEVLKKIQSKYQDFLSLFKLAIQY